MVHDKPQSGAVHQWGNQIGWMAKFHTNSQIYKTNLKMPSIQNHIPLIKQYRTFSTTKILPIHLANYSPYEWG